jgi:hypothetical protein
VAWWWSGQVVSRPLTSFQVKLHRHSTFFQDHHIFRGIFHTCIWVEYIIHGPPTSPHRSACCQRSDFSSSIGLLPKITGGGGDNAAMSMRWPRLTFKDTDYLGRFRGRNRLSQIVVWLVVRIGFVSQKNRNIGVPRSAWQPPGSAWQPPGSVWC